jgi:GH35 family endo-1,4-beta-xylanase
MAEKILSRRGFLKAVGLIAAVEILDACAPKTTAIHPTPDARASLTQSTTAVPATNTEVMPTAAPPTETPQPKVTVDGVGEVSELEAARFKTAQSDYRRAFQLGEDQSLPFTTASVKDSDGKAVDFALMTTPDGEQLPVMLFDQQKKTWEKASLRVLAGMRKMGFAMPFNSQYFSNPGYKELIADNANTAMMTEDMACFDVFKKFTTDTWRSMLKDWTNVKAQFDQGVVPAGYQYNWAPSKQVVENAAAYGMKIIGPPLLWPNDVLDSVYQGEFSSEELSHILEFTTKARVLQYKGQIQEWIVEAEGIIALGYLNVNDDFHNKTGIFYKKLGGQTGTDVVVAVARWAKEADPSATLRIVEDHVLEQRFGNLQPGLNTRLFSFLKRIKAEGTPIDKVDIENNLWIYSPPTEQHMIDVMKQILDQGFSLATSEATVITSKEFPTWYEQPAAPQKVSDPAKAQADLYNAVLRAYLKVGANGFGFGGTSDAYSWYQYHEKEGGEKVNGMILDQDNKPKQAYYAIAQTLFDYATDKLV